MTIHYSKAAQIIADNYMQNAVLQQDEASAKIIPKYPDYIGVFIQFGNRIIKK